MSSRHYTAPFVHPVPHLLVSIYPRLSRSPPVPHTNGRPVLRQHRKLRHSFRTVVFFDRRSDKRPAWAVSRATPSAPSRPLFSRHTIELLCLRSLIFISSSSIARTAFRSVPLYHRKIANDVTRIPFHHRMFMQCHTPYCIHLDALIPLSYLYT